MATILPADIERVALLGWHVYPMSRRSKAGCFKGAAAAATSDLEQLEQWARAYPGCNWRVVCGPSGLFALDVDRPGTHHADGFASLTTLTAKHGALPTRPMTRTGGSGGAALFFRHDGQPLRGESNTPAPGLDPHRGAQAIVIPPSRHPVTGGAYTWRVPPWECSPPAIPTWLAGLLAPPPEPRRPRAPEVTNDSRARRRLLKAVDLVLGAPSGAANDTLNRQAYAVARHVAAGALSETEAVDALYAAARNRKIPHPEAKDTIRSAFKGGYARPLAAFP